MMALLQQLVHPADSAFVCGKLDIATVTEGASQAALHWNDSLFLVLSATVFLVVGMLMLRRFVNIAPYLLGCLIRWKECVNLEDSAKLSRDRNIVAIYAVFPLSMVCSVYHLFSPRFMEGLSLQMHFVVTLAILLAFFGLRLALSVLMRPSSVSRKPYRVSYKVADTFLISLTFVILATAGLLSFIGVGVPIIRQVLLWESAAVYAVLLLRRAQILNGCLSFFTTFLYLCTLEILPVGLLVAVAVIF